jgi:glycosyltransferase involved in cell wall biosynthesis
LKRILQFADSLATSNGGPARNSFELNRALNRVSDAAVDLVWFHGAREESVLADGPTLSPDPGRPGPRRLRPFGRRSAEGELNLLALIGDLRRCDAVIVHGFYLNWVPPVLFVAMILRKPVVLMPHGALTLYESSKKASKKALFRRVLNPLVARAVSALAVGSQREAADASALLPHVRSAVCGVGTTLPELPSPHQFNAPLQLLTLGRLAPKKRVDLAVRTVAALIGRGVSVRLTVAGVGPERRALGRLADELGVKDEVAFIGEVSGSAKRSAYLSADLFILPSEDENFGIVIAEALAHGLPVIASTNVEAANIAGDGAARLLTHVDEDAIADAAIELSTHDRRQLSATARSAAEQRFDWDRVASRWLSLIEGSRAEAR